MSTCDRIVRFIRDSSANRRTVESNDYGRSFMYSKNRHSPKAEP